MISVINLLAQAVRQQARYQSGPVADLSRSVANSILGPEPTPAPEPETDEDSYEGYEDDEFYEDECKDCDSYEEEQEELTKHEPVAVSADVWKHKQFRDLNKTSLKEFRKYHEDRPEIFDSFYTLASKTRNAGNGRYSAKCLMEVIRWEQDLQTPGGFKIDNNYTSLYARLLMAYDPSFEGFFELRNAYGPASKKK